MFPFILKVITIKGTSKQTALAKKISFIMESAVICPFIHSIVVVMSPIGDQAPPAFAAMITMPSQNMQNSSEGIYDVKSLKEFTNRQTKIHVAVKVKNNNLTIFINNKELTASPGFKLQYGADCKVCGLPDGTVFNSLFFTNTTNNADSVKVYISNVKISKN